MMRQEISDGGIGYASLDNWPSLCLFMHGIVCIRVKGTKIITRRVSLLLNKGKENGASY